MTQILRITITLWTLGFWGLPSALTRADDQATQRSTESDNSPISYTAPMSFEMLIGVKITSADGTMKNTSAHTVFPTDWPEQSVQIVETNLPPELKATFRDLPGNNKQLLLSAPKISPGSPVEGTIRVRITKSHIVAPQETSHLTIPKRIDRTLKQFLGPSPQIDPGLGEIKRIVKHVDQAKPGSDWQRIEMFYDWVRDNIEYTNGSMKPIQEALKDRAGDCEEMTGIFVALCRAARVPARCVWIPNHCYPEFYLEDENHQGHWFPCQVAGTRNFGNMPEYMPILQKGDRFKVPEQSGTLRYLADYLSSADVTGREKPTVEFIRKLLGDAATLPAADAGLRERQVADEITPEADAQTQR